MREWMVKIVMSAAVLLPLTGCLESTVTTSCTTMAESRCGTCYGCALDAAGLSGAQLCGMNTGTDETTCVEMLTDTCESQANARQLNNDELDLCEEKLKASTSCTPLYEFATQGHQSLPTQCRVLF